MTAGLAVVVSAGRGDLAAVEDTLTALAAQSAPVQRVLVTTRAARRLVGAFDEPGWTAARGDPRRWLGQLGAAAVAGGLGEPGGAGALGAAGGPGLATVLQAGDVPFGHWAESLLAPDGPVAVFGRVAHQPAERDRTGVLLATGPAVVAADDHAAALPLPVAAGLPLAWWRTARRSDLPAGTETRSVDSVLLLRRAPG